MATSHHDAVLSSASPLTSTKHRRLGHLQTPPPSDGDAVPDVSSPPSADSVATIDAHDASFSLSSAASVSDGDWSDVTSHDTPTFGVVQLKAGFVWLFQLVIALVVQVAVIASDVVSLKDRVTAVEDIQTPASVHGQETEALARQVSELRGRVASQEDRITHLERLRHAETESYKKTIKELTTTNDETKSDDEKTRDDAFENLCQSFKNFQMSMECQAARITAVKADTARKIAVLQSELAGVRTELAQVKMVAVPADNGSVIQAAKEARKARILASVAQRMEDPEMAREVDKLCPLPPVVARNSPHVTITSTLSGGSPITLPSYGKPEGMKVKSLKITKEPLATARTNAVRPCADKIPAKSMIPSIPVIPLPTIPMERTIPAKSSGKENKPCDRSMTWTTLQHTHTFQPGAGRTPDVRDEPPTASRKKAWPSAGSPSEISALATRQPRRSMLPAPRKSRLPSLAKHAVVVDGSLSKDVRAGNRPPGGSSEARTKPPKTVKGATIATHRSPLESPRITLVKEPAAVLPASSSLAALDVALQAMELDSEDLLAPMPAVDCDALSFSLTPAVPASMRQRRKRDKYESNYGPPKQRNVRDVKPSRSPLKSMLSGNEVTTPASSLPDDEYDYPTLDLGFPTIVPIYLPAKPPFKRESVYASPVRTVKPSQRL